MTYNNNTLNFFFSFSLADSLFSVGEGSVPSIFFVAPRVLGRTDSRRGGVQTVKCLLYPKR